VAQAESAQLQVQGQEFNPPVPPNKPLQNQNFSAVWISEKSLFHKSNKNSVKGKISFFRALELTKNFF
jgi:hypothetical protein